MLPASAAGPTNTTTTTTSTSSSSSVAMVVVGPVPSGTTFTVIGDGHTLTFDSTGAQIGDVPGPGIPPEYYQETATGAASSVTYTNTQVISTSVSVSVSTITFGSTSVTNTNTNTNTNTDWHTVITNTYLVPQTIEFAQPPDTTSNAGPITLDASASSGLLVSYTSSTTSVCTVSGASVTLLSVGTCTITATQDGNGLYASATPPTRSFGVTLASTPSQTTPLAYTGASIRFELLGALGLFLAGGLLLLASRRRVRS
jgi:hypothetical protein